MFIYLLPFFLLLVAQVLLLLGAVGKKLSRAIAYVSIFIIFLITALKGDVDPDYRNYKYLFDIVEIQSGFWRGYFQALSRLGGLEALSAFVMYVIKFLGGSFQLFYVVFSAFSCAIIFYFSRVSKIEISVATFFIYCFYFYGFWVITRFLLGALLGLLSIAYFYRSGLVKKPFVMALLGAGVHRVSFFAVPVVFTIRHFGSFIKRNILSIIILSIPVAVVDLSGLFSFFVSDAHRYHVYIRNSVGGDFFSFITRFLFVFSLLAYLKHCCPRVYYENTKYDFILVMVPFMLFSWALAVSLGIFYRVGLFFDISFLYFFLVAGCLRNIFNRVVFIFPVFAYAAYRVAVGAAGLEPYRLFN